MAQSWQPGQKFNQNLNARSDGKGRKEGDGGEKAKWPTELQGDMRHACVLLFRHSLFLRFPHVQSKQAGQTPVCSLERERERELGGGKRERDEGDMQAVRHTELLPSDVSDGPIWFKSLLHVLSPKPGGRVSVRSNWTWWLKCCESGLTNSHGSVLRSLSCTPSTGYPPSFHHFTTAKMDGTSQRFSPLALYLPSLWTF